MPRSAPSMSESDLPPPAPRRRPLNPWLPIALLAIAVAGWQGFDARSRLAAMETQLARLQAQGSDELAQVRGASQQLRDQLAAMHGQLAAVETRVESFDGLRDSLQGLLDEASRSRDEVALLDVEQAIVLASQQLQLAGNVPAALLALQVADSRLARLDRPAWLPLRKALATDLQRLGDLPVVDTVGLGLRLEQLVNGIDRLPLAAYGRPGNQPKIAPSEPAATAPWWQLAAGDVWQQLRGLVRIQRFDGAAPELMAADQALILRENLKLRLLSARLALMARDQATYRDELKVAYGWLEKYYLADDPAVQSALATLRQAAATAVQPDVPALTASLTALRNLRPGKEKR